MHGNIRHQLIGWFVIAGGAVAPCRAGSTPLTTERVASGLTRPVYVTHAPNDFTRIFVVEQPGRIRVYDITQNPVVLIGTFMDITARVLDTGNEQGLLGMAFHPNYAANNFFYVNYTNNSGHTRVSRFTVPMGTPNAADPNSELILLTVTQPESNHNGGWIDFGPNDGYLYIGMGDGGGGGDVHGTIGNGQDINALLGKMLRIDVDGNNGPGGLYGIPASNPFVGVAGADEIWAYGLRNPWRNAFDQLTGDLYIADVGQNAWEEIDFQPATSTGGENWGWRCREGAHNFNFQANCNGLTLLDPIHEFSHGGSPFRCSITGGEVYRGCAVPDLQGTYFFADYCSNQIWSFIYTGSPIPVATDRTAELAPGGGLSISSISGFGRDAYGEIYICDLSGGEVFRIIPSGVPNACFCDPGADTDGDTFNDCADSCPNVVNAMQADADLDAAGDLCDPCPGDAADGCDPAGSKALEITAATGGTLVTTDGSCTVEVEPGDLAANVTLGVTRDDVQTQPVISIPYSGQPRQAQRKTRHKIEATPAQGTLPSTVRVRIVAEIPLNPNSEELNAACLASAPTQAGTWTCASENCAIIESPPGVYTADCEALTDHFSEWSIAVILKPVNPPTAAVSPDDRAKNRYISFGANNPGQSIALRIQKMTAPTGTCYAGIPDVNGNSLCNPAPVFRVWTGSVHVGDCEIIPVATYQISATSDGIIFTAPLTVNTIPVPALNNKLWGDLVGSNGGTEWTPPNQFTNVNDILGVLAYLANQAVKPTFQQANLQAVSSNDPCLNALVNTADVLIVVRAVAGDGYPFTNNPALCPSCP